MRVTFVLPGRARQFSGGFRVLYAYAAGLADLGHDVVLIHTPFLGGGDSAVSRARVRVVYKAGRLGWVGWRPFWLPSHSRLTSMWVPGVSDEYLPDADALVVSFHDTAARVGNVSSRKGRRFYLIQEYELFKTASPARQQRMAEAFRLPFRRFAISPAVERMLEGVGAPAHARLPNGIDLEQYRMLVPIDAPDRSLVGFPHRPESFKQSELAVAAVVAAREQLGRRIGAWAFGSRRPSNWPSDIQYICNPSSAELANLYNRTSVFVTPSDFEGWGLPGSEAMACGAALVSTDNGGVHAYAAHGHTALISPPRDLHALAGHLVQLLQDPAVRFAIATRGQQHVQQFSWPAAVGRLAGLLEPEVGTR